MRSFTIAANDASQRIDRFLSKAMPGLPLSAVQKGIRTKNIKLNGARCSPQQRLSEGDELTVYVPEPSGSPPAARDVPSDGIGKLNIVYQDKNIIILNKPVGLQCQNDADRLSQDTLESRVRAYLAASGEWNPRSEHSFVPSLCHRLDRNTEGLVLAAKTAEALRILTQKIKDREVVKRYLCVVHGHPKPPEGRLEDYLFKDARRNFVMVKKNSEKGAKTAIMDYRTLDIRGNLSLIECTLLTGRTHQIRVQMASRGWPLLGDGKYGSANLDKAYSRKGQALCAYKISFNFITPAGALQYLGGREFLLHKKFENFC